MDGTYNVEVQRPKVVAKGILKVKTEGDHITGYYEAHENKQPLTGTISDNNFTVFTAIGEPPKQKKVKFTGTYKDSEITGVLSGIDDSDPSNFHGIKVM